MFLSARYKKNGAPKNAVITPIGTSVGANISLPKVSHMRRKKPPANIVLGRSFELDGPKSILIV